MNDTYFIRGTISIQVDDNKSKIWITPCAGFLTPDKQQVIAFPVPSPKGKTKGKTKGKAKLNESDNDKQFRFKAKTNAIRDNIPALLVVAAQQKPIELRLEVSNHSRLVIIGFIFPAPSDHAHRC